MATSPLKNRTHQSSSNWIDDCRVRLLKDGGLGRIVGNRERTSSNHLDGGGEMLIRTAEAAEATPHSISRGIEYTKNPRCYQRGCCKLITVKSPRVIKRRLPLIFSGLPRLIGVKAVHFFEKLECLFAQIFFIDDAAVAYDECFDSGDTVLGRRCH